MGWHAGLPLEGSEIVGNRANGVGGTVEQVNFAVTVKVDRIPDPARGHELRHTHGAGVAAKGG